MLTLRVEDLNENELATFEAGWSSSDIEEWMESEGLDSTVVRFFVDEGSQDWEDCSGWQLYQLEEVCELLSSFDINGWKPNREMEEAAFLYLQNNNFSPSCISSFADAFIGKYKDRAE